MQSDANTSPDTTDNHANSRLVFEIMKNAAPIIMMNNTLPKTDSSDIQHYVGDASWDSTFYNRGTYGLPKPSNKTPLTASAQLSVDLHRVFRRRLPELIDITLDEQKLDAYTLSAMNEARKAVTDFTGAWTAKLTGRADTPLISDKEADRIVIRLEKSQLSNREATLPLLVNGKPMAVSNAQSIGSFLFAFSIGKNQLRDQSKIPDPLAEYIESQIGTDVEIIKGLVKKCRSPETPELKAPCDAALAACLPDLIAAIRKNSRPLQIFRLLDKKNFKDKGLADGSRRLLEIAGVPFKPDHITPQECALMLADLLQMQEATTALKNVAELYGRDGKAFLPPEQLESALATLDKMKDVADKNSNEPLAMKIGLVHDELSARRQGPATDHRPLKTTPDISAQR